MELDNSIINNNIIFPNFKLEQKDPEDDDLEDLNLFETYGFRIKNSFGETGLAVE